MGCGPGALLQRCLRTRWRYRTVVALCLSLVVGVNVGLFLQIASVADEALDPDPPLAPATYNIWNYNNYWSVRKLRIAEVIRNSQLDIVGLQEVRNVASLGGNQLDHLKELLPEYPHSIFYSAHIAKSQNLIEMTVPDPEEGVAVLSKHPIVHTETFTLTTDPDAEDQNVRVVILAHVDVPKVGLVYFFVTHLSFVPLIQCRHVYELLRIVRSLDLDHLRPKIVVGDFNFFPDSEDPAAFFEQDWNEGDPGFTFSNLPWAEQTHTYPARPTRPDRIYLSGLAHGESKASHGLVPRRIVRQEDGVQYRREYYWRLMAHRTRHLIRTIIEPASNTNTLFTYQRLYSDFYIAIADLWNAPAPAADEDVEGDVDEQGNFIPKPKPKPRLVGSRKKRSRKASNGEEEEMASDTFPVEDYYFDLSHRLFGFAIHRLVWDAPFHQPFYAIAVAPSVLLCAITLAAWSCCCRLPRSSQARVTCRQRSLRYLCGCVVLGLLVIVPVVLCAVAFLLPIFLTDYVDDLVPSDHRLVVATFFT